MKSKPFVSIIVAVYNGQATISGCLKSLLAQDYPKEKFEIIVVDNNSTDHTAELVREFPVTYVLETTQGPAAARNRGVKESKGEALLFFDSDQIADKSYLPELLQGWDNEKYGAFGSREKFIYNGDPMVKSVLAQEEVDARKVASFKRSGYLKLGGGNALYRKDVFQKLRGFDESMFSSEDFDLAIRMQKELHLKVKYNFDAIFYHHTRGWKQFLKREYYIGYWDNILSLRHPQLKKGFLSIFFEALKRSVLGFLVAVWYLIKFCPVKKKQKKIMAISSGILLLWTNIRGRLKSKVDVASGKFKDMTAYQGKSTKHHLGFYSNTEALGGSEVYLKQVLERVDMDLYEVCLFLPSDHPLMPWARSNPAFQIVCLNSVIEIKGPGQEGPASLKIKADRSLTQRIWDQLDLKFLKLSMGVIKDIVKLKTMFENNRVELLHFNDTGCEPPIIAARLAGVKRIIGTYHVMPSYDERKMDFVRRAIEYISIRCMHEAISVSNATKMAWIKRAHLKKDNVKVIFNGIDLSRFTPLSDPQKAQLRVKEHFDARDVLVGVPARLHPMKGHKYLIAAVPEIKRAIPRLRMLFIGEGDLKGELVTQVKELNLQDTVYFMGHRTDMKDLFNILDLVVLPSVSLEALPISLIEAMACEKAIVASRFSGIPEVVADNVTGLLVPPGDSNALGAAIIELLTDQERIKVMGEKGRVRAQMFFSDQRMLRETFGFYEQILAADA